MDYSSLNELLNTLEIKDSEAKILNEKNNINQTQLERDINLNANFYCLQNEIWGRDKDYLKSLNLIDCSKYMLDEVASIIKNLDLVITVDTSLLHLSASLNKETWGILSLYPDWRWGKFNNINPYKRLKFFKQENFIDWKNVENSIFKELSLRVENFK